MRLKDGCKLGSFVGTEVVKVGSVVGSNMRLKEEFELGLCVGSAEGNEVGIFDGSAVGDTEGEFDG